MLGSKIGNYTVNSRLAQGGMGEVYVARHQMMGRDAVVKVLRPEMSAKKDMVRRFFNEARAATSIHHPGIVEVFDMGYMEDGRAYLVMEKLRGDTLAARLARQEMSLTHAVSITRQIAGALGAAHAKGIVHRDLKPDNLFLVPDPEVPGGERVKILDFGIAKLSAEQGGSLMTAAGSIFGTPAYMAPEQCQSSATVDHRADLYAVGCIFYELLCGAPPFGHGGIELLAAHLRDAPPSPRQLNPHIPEPLERVLLRLLEKERDARYPSCGEVIAALDAAPELQTGQSISGAYLATMAAGSAPPGAMASGATAPASHPPAGAVSRVAGAGSGPPAATPYSGAMVTATSPSPPPIGVTAWVAAEQHPGPLNPPPATGGLAGGTVEPSGQRSRSVTPVMGIAVQSEPPASTSWPSTEPAHPITTHSLAAGEAAPTIGKPPARTGLRAALAVIAVIGVAAGVFAAMKLAGSGDDSGAARNQQVDQLLAAAHQAADAENWALAAGKAAEVLDLAPNHQAARDLKLRSESEIRNGGTLDELLLAAQAKRHEDVARLYAALPEGSPYRAKAERPYRKSALAWVGQNLELGQRYVEEKRCTELESLSWDAAELFPDARDDFRQLVYACDKAPWPAVSNAAAPAADKTVAANLVEEARAAAKSGEFRQALTLCEKALAGDPSPADTGDAAMVCVIAACNLQDRTAAKRHIKQLRSKERKSMAVQICRKQGVTGIE